MAATKTKKHRAKPRTPAVKTAKAKAPAKYGDLATDALKRIMRAERDVTEARKNWRDAKETAKNLKGVYDSQADRLYEIIREETDESPNLFKASNQATPAKNGKHIDKPAQADDESWRAEPLTMLAIPKGTIGKLAESHITTVGEYCDYLTPQANGFQPRLTDIKGIGGQAITKIEDAVEQFFAKRKARMAAETTAAVEDVAASTELPGEPSTNGTGEAMSDSKSD